MPRGSRSQPRETKPTGPTEVQEDAASEAEVPEFPTVEASDPEPTEAKREHRPYFEV